MANNKTVEAIKRLNLDYQYIKENILTDESQYRKVLDDIWDLYDSVLMESYEAKSISLEKVHRPSNSMPEKDLGGYIVKDLQDGIEVYLPRLLPNKKKISDKNGDIELFKTRLNNAVKHFISQNENTVFFTSKVDITIHQYFKNKSSLKDYDNCDIKQAIDALAAAFMRDDSPLEYNLHMYGDIDGQNNYTIIRIIPEIDE